MSLLFMFQTCAFYDYFGLLCQTFDVVHGVLVSWKAINNNKCIWRLYENLKRYFQKSKCLLKFITFIYMFIYTTYQFCFFTAFLS